jgi:hypothetical protein
MITHKVLALPGNTALIPDPTKGYPRALTLGERHIFASDASGFNTRPGEVLVIKTFARVGCPRPEGNRRIISKFASV